MEKRNSAVLSAIIAYSPAGESVVVSKDELIGKLPQKLDVNKVKLALILGALATEELIKIKFEDEARYCICSTAKGRAIAKGDAEAETTLITAKGTPINTKKLCILCGLSAFVGSLIASGIGLLIYFLVVTK